MPVDGKPSGASPRQADAAGREPEWTPPPVRVGVDRDVIVPSKALSKLIAAVRASATPAVLDLGPAIGSNISYFAEQLGCKVYVEDVFSTIERLERERRVASLSTVLAESLRQEDDSVDGILCWDVFDFLDRASAQVLAAHLMRVLRVNGALSGFFSTAQPVEAHFTKFIIVDEQNLRHRWYSAPRMRQAVLQNRDIIKLFDRLRVSDSFLLQASVRELLFRKPAYLTTP